MPKRGTAWIPAGSMPWKARRTLKRRHTVSAYRKGARKRNAIVRVPRNKLAYPQRMSTKLRYVQEGSFDLSSSTDVKVETFRANSIYDPYYPTAATHQPRGYNEFMATYSMFTVTKCTISATFVYESYDGPALEDNATGQLLKTTMGLAASAADETNAQSAVCVGIHKGTEELTAGAYAKQIEKDKQKWTYMVPVGEPKTISTSAKISDFFGPFAIGASGFSGEDSAGAGVPDNEVLFTVWAGKVNTNNTNVKTRLLATILMEYDVTFTEPKPLKQST